MNTMHYGKFVDSDVPVTGVHSINDIDWGYVSSDICLVCEQWAEDNPGDDGYECDSSHTKIIGDWTFDTKTREYSPTEGGEFSALLREDVVQVIASRYTRRGALCSPCYPGQVDLDTPGDYLGFCLPDEWLVKEE